MGRLYNTVVWISLTGLLSLKRGFLPMRPVGRGVLEHPANLGPLVPPEKKPIHKLLIDDFITFIIYDLLHKFKF